MAARVTTFMLLTTSVTHSLASQIKKEFVRLMSRECWGKQTVAEALESAAIVSEQNENKFFSDLTTHILSTPQIDTPRSEIADRSRCRPCRQPC
jgi:hypothetical protein